MEKLRSLRSRNGSPRSRSDFFGALTVALIGLTTALVAAGDAATDRREAPRVEVRSRWSAPPSDNVVLVTIDGVRFQEIFGGVDPALARSAHIPERIYDDAKKLMPNAHRLFFEEGAVVGDPRLRGGIVASGPHYVSLPGYLEIMTGARSACTENTCLPNLTEPTLAEDVASAARSGPLGVAVFASWERIASTAARDATAIFVRAGKSERDDSPPFPGQGAYRPDHFTAARAIEHLVRNRPRFLWIALGDTDEWAHRGDYRGYLEALRAADGWLGEIAGALETMGSYGARTTLIVTADHGRDADFSNHGGGASAAVWLFARGSGIARVGSVPTVRKRHLRDIAPTVRALLGLQSNAAGEPIDELFPPRLASAEGRPAQRRAVRE